MHPSTPTHAPAQAPRRRHQPGAGQRLGGAVMVERLRALGSPALAQFNAWLRRETLPGIFDVLLGSIDIMQARITQANLRALEVGDATESGRRARQTVTVRQGLDAEHARAVVKRIKESKLKVQTAIQGDEVRVSAKSRDELQAVIAVLRKADDLDLPLQFLNVQD